MHVVFRESRGLEETEVPTDPGQGPADLVVLSYSDSDLGAFAAGWQRAAGGLPALRLCNLSALRHPISVDQYCEATLSGARAVLVRLIGGEPYWPYGTASLQDLARRRGIALAFLPADGRPDPTLDRFSTLPVPLLRRLAALCDQGGAVAGQMALAELAQAAGLPAAPVRGEATIPDFGFYDPDRGVIDRPEPGVLVSFYRSYLTAADLAPVDAMIRALRGAGLAATGVFAPSLKAPGFADWLAPHLPGLAAVVNLTAFSARDDAGATPFDGADCPVFQVALSTAPRTLWVAEERGLSAADLAMHVVLPEVDGRIFLGAISFKEPQERDPDLQFARVIHAPDPDRIDAAVARITAWHRLRQAARRAVVLSTYPGKAHQLAHAVGLDALASCGAILGIPHDNLGRRLTSQRIAWPLDDYHEALATLPQRLRDDLAAAWGEPPPDGFRFAAIRHGTDLIALQPERGEAKTRADDYHDLTRTPRHEYVAFYLWLRGQADVLIHMGAHGTLEWLPGKSVALSDECWPEALLADLPVIYPFIVNDPGEAAQAKRRLSAVTLGHLPPPLVDSGVPENLTHLERLLDEYSTADGLDPRRR
ncbi:cobaltochelatase subunit CobN, partial [Paracoccus sp. PXZ]